MSQHFLSSVRNDFGVEEITDVISPELWEVYSTYIDYVGEFADEYYETPSSEGGEKIITYLSHQDREDQIGKIIFTSKAVAVEYWEDISELS
jgi:hypothetical protein